MIALTRRAALAGMVLAALPGTTLAAPAAPGRLELGRPWPWPWWRGFVARHPWAAADPPATLPTLAAWRVTLEAIDVEVDAWPYRDGVGYPRSLPAAGDPVNCVEAALWKGRLAVEAGFPAGVARLLILQAPDAVRYDHGALLLHLAEGDTVIDNRNARAAVADLHPVSALRRRPRLVTDGRGQGRVAGNPEDQP